MVKLLHIHQYKDIYDGKYVRPKFLQLLIYTFRMRTPITHYTKHFKSKLSEMGTQHRALMNRPQALNCTRL